MKFYAFRAQVLSLDDFPLAAALGIAPGNLNRKPYYMQK
jgi:hypothetical protein